MNPAKLLALALLLAASGTSAKDEPLLSIGVARIDITPDYPVRLHGYGGRRTNSEGVAQHLFAKALALGPGRDAFILFTVDNLAVSGAVADEVAARLKKRAGIARENIALCSSHTHSAPVLTGVAPNIFSSDIIPEQLAAIDRYTRELVDNLERAGLAALSNRAPSKLSWSEGTVTFAKNRRVVRNGRSQFGDNDAGPVDHTLATMFVHGADGKLRGVLANYACHCTTLGGEWNQIHGDWCGYAQAAIERDHPGAIALISIGCGADANPFPRGKLENAQAHGDEIATEVRRLLALPSQPLAKLPESKIKRFQLDFDPLPTRAQWEERATKPGIVGYHAKKNLARLERGEKLPTKLPYIVQTWTFDDRLAMVFLAGEVVVDYERRLKREFDDTRLWVNGYANDVPCYIPSQRILTEGGYEAEDSLWYYDRPARLAMSSEDRIIKAVHDLLPKTFVAKTNRAGGPQPLSPKQALNSMRVAPEFAVDLVAAEPLVVDPVAIDWGADGKLWVVEMCDYPMGMDGKWKPGGRVKFLEDTNHDGRYDQATVFLDHLPFPTGVFAWRKGALVCAAPDIIYAEDTNGDGRADIVRTIFTGFATNNYQARVNSLSLGLDNWIYGANGLLGGKIHFVGGTGDTSPALKVEDSRSSPLQGELDIRGRDFRMNPDTGAFEPASGLTQQGRVRDDFGNWFGCDNSHLLWHYPLADEYVRRNPHVAAPNPAVQVPQGRDWNRLFPASRTLERFNSPESANRVTSACGLEIYRDELLGQEFYGNAFICEPVHNLVHREVLTPDGVTFRSARATNEPSREFLASTDNWFRPVQARTGPDGAVWVVDMYRYVIEHPRWIPSNRLAQLDVRAGDDKGRIYRVYRRDNPPRATRNLAKLPTPELAATLDSPNGTERDIIHRELLNRGNVAAVGKLIALATNSSRPAVRIQASSLLAAVAEVPAGLLSALAKDRDAAVRQNAIRLCDLAPNLPVTLATATRDEDIRVRYQAALSLSRFEGANESLRPLLLEATTNQWFRAAVLSSPRRSTLLATATQLPSSPGQAELVQGLLASLDYSGPAELAHIVSTILPADDEHIESWRFNAAAKLLQRYNAIPELNAARLDLESWEMDLLRHLRTPHSLARSLATNSSASAELRRAAMLFVGNYRAQGDVNLLAQCLTDVVVQEAAINALLHGSALPIFGDDDWPKVAAAFIDSWRNFSPQQRLHISEALASRTETLGALLTALDSRTIPPAEISLSLRDKLARHPAKGVRDMALKIWPRRESDRAALIGRYRKAIKPAANIENGSQVFDRTCANCHALNGRGHAVGPDLLPLRDKSADDFLLAILDPNAAIEPRYVNYIVETKSGNVYYGVIHSETATGLEIVSPGLEQNLLRSEIAKIEAMSLSLMPEGLEQGISPTEMNDLIAFLKKAAPRTFGSATSEQIQTARKEFRARQPNGFGKLLFASEQIDYPGWLGRVPLLHCRQTDGKSRVAWQTMPAKASDGSSSFTLAAALGFISQPAGKFTLNVNGKRALDFDVVLDDSAWTSQDGRVRMSYHVVEANSEDGNGSLTITLSPEIAKENTPVTFEVIGSAANSQRWFGIYDVNAVATAAAR